MEIKTTVRYHFTPVRTAIIKKSTNNKYWRGYEERESLPHCWWESKLAQPLWRTVWRFLKHLNIELLYDLALLGIYMCVYIYTYIYIYMTKEKTNLKRYMHPNVHSSIIYNGQDIESHLNVQQMNG